MTIMFAYFKLLHIGCFSKTALAALCNMDWKFWGHENTWQKETHTHRHYYTRTVEDMCSKDGESAADREKKTSQFTDALF